jgi:hypothetical protein
MHRFEAGKTYTGRYITDSDSIHRMTVAKRTEKQITTSEGKRLKVHTDEQGDEYVYPHGRYSMAMIIRAERDADRFNESKPVAFWTPLVMANVAETWSLIASEPITLIQTPSGNVETRNASEAACTALQAAFPAGRIYHTVTLGWRFVMPRRAA